MEYLLTAMPAIIVVIVLTVIAIALRRVVETNEVHIVQSRKKTTSFGKGQAKGNVYWHYPSWVPLLGVTVIRLPVSNFAIELESYEAYDVDRVPFDVDIVAFFRIADSGMAAERVDSFQTLREQLHYVVQGSVRTILAKHDINTIMLERATFGEQFTKEVETQLKDWGVIPVKNIELMDIRDAEESKVIHDIMAKKKSHIEMESRIEVANNNKMATIAETEADRDADIKMQEALQQVGQRTAEKDKAIGVANEQAQQDIKEQARVTKEKEMAITQVATVRQAEITRDQEVIAADQDKQTTVLIAEGKLEATKRAAEGIEVEGAAKAAAEKAMQLAPIEAQIVLAKEIGENDSYQQYLVTIRQVEANQVVGVEQAKALVGADLKVIANTGDPVTGVSDIMGLFTPKGGTSIAGMLEGIAQSPAGKAAMNRLGITGIGDKPVDEAGTN